MIHYLRTEKRERLRGVALVRLDFNTKDGDWRMEAALPTLRLLVATSRAVVIMSHYGRPKPVVDIPSFSRRGKGRFSISESGTPPSLPLSSEGGSASGGERGGNAKFTLKKDAADLARLLKKKVEFLPNFDFDGIKAKIAESPRGSVFLLENLRFIKGEEENDAKFAKTLASLGDFYVNDAFAVSHRADASVAAITKFLPSYAGLELEKEITFLSRVMQKPSRPLVLVLGGAKAGDKLGVLGYFKNRADLILLGGGAANTMLALRGMDVRKSLRDTDAKELRLLKPLSKLHKIIAPIDYVWNNGRILDLGPKAILDFAGILSKAQTIIWSGPLGMTDDKRYQNGSLSVARAIVKNRHAFSLVGGGETVGLLKKHHLDKKFSFISTGGGAMLDFLAGKRLPGIEALEKLKRV
jgi:phosphoglycerate kinase